MSVATVSLALNNHPRVSKQTRLKIAQAATRLGYVPNNAARRLAHSRFQRAERNRFDSVGFIFVQPSTSPLDASCLTVMSGVEHELSKVDASMVFVRVTDAEHWKKVERVSRAYGVDGWLVVGPITDEDINRLKARNQPHVILGSHRCLQPVNVVDVDHKAAGRIAVQHLAALGHRRIGFLGGTMRFQYQRDAMEGFRTVVRELGLDGDEQLLQTAERDPEVPSVELVFRLLSLTPRPTAIICSEAYATQTVLTALRQRNVDLPREMSVIAFEVDGTHRDPLSSTIVELSYMGVGSEGALLLKKVAEQKSQPPQQIQISPSLVEGWSCCPPDGSGRQ